MSHTYSFYTEKGKLSHPRGVGEFTDCPANDLISALVVLYFLFK